MKQILHRFLLGCEEYSDTRQNQEENVENQTRNIIIANILVLESLPVEQTENGKEYYDQNLEKSEQGTSRTEENKGSAAKWEARQRQAHDHFCTQCGFPLCSYT